DQIAVYPLGLGYGYGINEARLTDLAEATGGAYRITSDDLVFRKFFLEVLAGAVDWTVIVDPIGELGRGEITTVPATITADQDDATFTVYWEGVDNAIDLELIAPSGAAITASGSGIYHGQHARYAFFQLDFPLSGDLAGDWAGIWQMKLTGTNAIVAGGKVRYSSSAFAEGGTELDVSFDRLYHLTGDSVLVAAHLTKYGQPVTGAQIMVYGDVPAVGIGNLLHKGKVSRAELQKPRIINGDTLDLIERKLQILADRAGRDIYQRGGTEFILYDDGGHGDGRVDDGIYANRFGATKIPGSYTFRFAASGIPTGAGFTTTREWTKSFYNEVDINAKFSDIKIKTLAKATDGRRYSLLVAPRDRFGNFLGPGHQVTIDIAHAGGERQVPLTDNIDGTYSGEFLIRPTEIEAGAQIKVNVDGRAFASVEPDGFKLWSASIHAGAAIPIGSFSDEADPGINILADFDYHINPQWSIVLFGGYNDFKANVSGPDGRSIINVSLNARYYRLLQAPLSIYVEAGPGIYIPDEGDTEPGGNAGIGIDYELNPVTTFEAGVDYHAIFDSDIQFLHSHAGVVFRF
ncbi:MAG: outer membrane beta-barrel protein, partial [Candidatus Zixiibacteriota bacterium]